jgi:hypothetical protein
MTAQLSDNYRQARALRDALPFSPWFMVLHPLGGALQLTEASAARSQHALANVRARGQES